MKSDTWNERDSATAVSIVTSLALKLIEDIVEGDTFRFKLAEPVTEVTVQKALIISVFEWIVKQTEGFKKAIRINFRYGNAPAIGLFFCYELSHRLGNQLYELNGKGISVPSFEAGWYYGPGSCYVRFSDLYRKFGAPGKGSENVADIELCGARPPRVQTVMLDSIG